MPTPVPHDANTDIERGQLYIFIDDKSIAFANSATLNVSTEETDISNKMMGGWSASLAGKNSFTLSSESLLTRKTGQLSFDTLLAAQIAKQTLSFFYGSAIVTDATNTGGKFEKDPSHKNYTGTVMITSLDLKSDDGQIASVSVSFKGVGALTPVEAVTTP